MKLPELQIGDIWLYENNDTNHPSDDWYLGPALVIDFEGYDKYNIRWNYEVLDLLRGTYDHVMVDEQNAIYWRQLT